MDNRLEVVRKKWQLVYNKILFMNERAEKIAKQGTFFSILLYDSFEEINKTYIAMDKMKKRAKHLKASGSPGPTPQSSNRKLSVYDNDEMFKRARKFTTQATVIGKKKLTLTNFQDLNYK